jgi:predicted acyltransferase
MSNSSTTRLQSLDAFRGFTIAAMILVNTPGNWAYLYPPLAHADWDGCTPTDLVFPFFLFIVGVSFWFSAKAFDHRLDKVSFQKIAKRTFLIFLIGLLLNAFPFYNMDLSSLRILGVLQRIAIAFGLGAVLCLLFKNTKALLALSVVLLLAYWGILVGFGGGDPYGLENNIVRHLDIKLFGESHLWQGKGIAFDPEGLLSSLPSVVTVIFGYLTGQMIGQNEAKSYLPKLLALGLGAIVAGYIWGFYFPINKSLWTSSYVLYTTGLALLCLSLFIWLIDVQKIKNWAAPFMVFGMNSIFAYVLSMVWVKILFSINWQNESGEAQNGYDALYQNIFVPLAGNLNGSLLFALAHVLLFWAICWILYRKKIFIKV